MNFIKIKSRITYLWAFNR